MTKTKNWLINQKHCFFRLTKTDSHDKSSDNTTKTDDLTDHSHAHPPHNEDVRKVETDTGQTERLHTTAVTTIMTIDETDIDHKIDGTDMTPPETDRQQTNKV